MKITEEKYKALKKKMRTRSISDIGLTSPYSRNTLYRVKRSKNFKDYRPGTIKPYNVTTVDDIIYDSEPRKNWLQRLFK